MLDTLGMFEVTAAAARAGGRGGQGRRRASRACRRHDEVENVRRAGHGRQRHRRRRAGRGGRAVHAGARSWCEGLRRRRRSSGEGTLCFAVSFSGNTEETLEAAQAAAAAGARMVVVDRRRRAGRAGAEPGGARTCRCPTDIPQPRAGLGALAVPPLVVLEQIGLFPGASGVGRRRGRAAHASGATALVAGDAAAAARPARSARTIPLIYGGGAARRRGRLPVEGPGQRERQGAGVHRHATPSCATTRSAAGASTAT